MAKIYTQTIAIVVSKIVKDGQEPEVMVDPSLVKQLEEAVSEMVVGGAVVEASIIE
jgi:hypothetical protein